MSLRPWYNKDANYQTNAKSFMDYLARNNHFLELLIEDYEVFQELVIAELERIKFDSEMEVEDILLNWLEDGTLERIINDGVLGNKADKTWVSDELELKADKQTLEEKSSEILNQVINLLDEQDFKVSKQIDEQDDKVSNQLNENNERVKDIENYLRTDEMLNEIWSWWIYPLAVYKNNMTFFGSVSNKGEVSVHSFNHVTREHQKSLLFVGSIDDHNSPSVNILDNGRIIVFYCTHNSDNIIRVRVSDNPYDITSLGTEKTHSITQNITYMQSHVDETGRIHLFTRRANKGWYYLQSIDNGNSWNIERTLIITDSGQFYLKIKPRKSRDNVEQIRLTFTGHVDNSILQDIYYCYMDLATGHIIIPNAESIGTVYTGEGVVFTLDDLLVAYRTPANKTTRLFDVSDNDLGILFSEIDQNNKGMYKYLKWDSNNHRFDVYDLIETGAVIGGGIQRSYFGGGVIVENKEDTIVLSREKDGIWYIERWELIGNKWETTLISKSSTKQFRPIIPRNNPYNVMFIKGEYHEDNFTTFNTDIIYKHNIQSDMVGNDLNTKYTVTGYSTFRNSEVIMYGDGAFIEQKGLDLVRVPLGSYNNTWRGSLDIEFDVPFKKIPEVFIQGHNYVFSVAISNVTETGFQINALRIFGESEPEYVGVRWFAKG